MSLYFFHFIYTALINGVFCGRVMGIFRFGGIGLEDLEKIEGSEREYGKI
jgi:hypothetical protein